MRTPDKLRWLVPAFTLVCALWAQPGAAADSRGQDIRIRELHVDIVVNGDATYTETTDLVEQLNTPRSVEQAGQIKVPYSASLDDFEIVEATTRKLDGRVIPVSRSSIFTQDGLISPQGLTSFQDIKTTVAVYPDLDPGDSIEMRTRLARKKPPLPGIFTYSRVFGGEFQYDAVQIKLSAPNGFPLSIENLGLTQSGPVAQGDRQIWTWTYQNSDVVWPEDDSVDPISYRPRLLISSAPSYDRVAEVVRQLFAGKAAASPAVRAAADSITAGAHGPREQARKLLEWVARNIRYFAVELDVGGYVPRTADDILSTRFGDCKDHAVVLQALLSAKGIPSTPALIGTKPIYELPKIPVMSAFNHAILFVPSLNVFLDTNTPSVSFGALPYEDADKPVLLLDAAAAQARTPPLTPETNMTTLTSTIQVAADGSATGQDHLTATGPSGIAFEAYADMLTGTDPVKLTKGLLLAASLAGEGTATAQRISNEKDFSFDLLYDLVDFAPQEQASAVRPVPPMDFMGVTARSSVASAPVRTVPYLCGARTDREIIDITFPPGTQLSLPRGISAAAADRSYESSYIVKANTVHVERHYISKVAHSVCPAEDYAASRALQEKVLRDLRAEIRYTPPLTSTTAGAPAP